MQNTASNTSTHPAAGRVDEAWLFDKQRLANQMETAESELQRLQGLLDDAMTRLAGAFGTLAEAAEAGRHQDARDVLVSTLQYHDICSQLLTHARTRITSGRALIDGDADAVLAHEARSHPVLHADLAPGDVELF